jgi:hypothetical protein
MMKRTGILLLAAVLLCGCAPGQPAADTGQATAPALPQTSTVSALETDEPTPAASEIAAANDQAVVTSTVEDRGDLVADVTSVQVSGSDGAYQFSVQVSSPDTGCDQYADWWEVLTEDGELVYRRVLLHSHVGEQPFTRSGGPAAIQAGTVVWVRAHMNTGGYGGQVLKGSVQTGFEPAELSPDFAADLADQPPLPEDCAF